MEDVVQEADQLKHDSFPAKVLPSKAEVEAHSVSHLPFRRWCSACVRGRGLRWVTAKSAQKRSTQSRYQRVLWTMDSSGSLKTEHTTHFQCSFIVRDRRSNGIWSQPVSAKGVAHPYPAKALLADLDVMCYERVILKSDQEPGVVTLCESVKTWLAWRGCPKHLRRARARATERSNVLSSPYTDWREPSRISWSSSLKSLWSREVRCWLGWWSNVLICSYSPTWVSHMTVTLHSCD